MTYVPPSMFGVPALRSEDPRFLVGDGRYVENIRIPGALRAVFVRSIMPHAAVRAIEGLDEARAMPGVAAVFTSSDLDIPAQSPSGNVESPDAGELEEPFVREVLARDRVRYAGEAIAVVIAETLAQAEDAAEMVWADVDPLDVVLDAELASVPGAPLLWPDIGTNVAHTFEKDWDTDTLAGADVVVRGRFVNQRVAPVPLEPNAFAMIPEPEGRYTVYVSTQVPFDIRNDVAELLGVERSFVRTIAPDVGGGFGAKLQIYPEFLVIAKAVQRLGRPVRWLESRSDSMLNLTHGRAQVQLVEIGARRDGEIVGLRAEIVADMGAYPIGAFLPTTTADMLAGVYRIPRIAYRGRSVVTNATPVAPYRGAGRPEATALVERAIDLVAAELRMDPVDVRRRNLIPADAFPFTTAVGMTYDSGDYQRALDVALRLADYDGLRAEQSARRARLDHLALGIGLSTYVEITSFSSKEFGSVQVEPSGDVTVAYRDLASGPGARDGFRPDRVGHPRSAVRRGPGGALRHGRGRARRGHVGFTIAAGWRVGRPGAKRRGRGPSQDDRGPHPGGRPGRSGGPVGGGFPGGRRPREGGRVVRARCSVRRSRPPPSGARPRASSGGGRLPRARLDLPVRRSRVRRGGRHSDGGRPSHPSRGGR